MNFIYHQFYIASVNVNGKGQSQWPNLSPEVLSTISYNIPSRPQFTEVTTFFPSSFPLKVGRQIGVIRH